MKVFRIGAGVLLWVAVVVFFGGCETVSDTAEDDIVIGAVLPFSGEQAALGINIEQALMLAVDDINDAGGVDGRQLTLVVRDSNAGSDAGYQAARELIYDQKVKYLIGPEENALAKNLVSDVKASDILNILPGIASPNIRETGDKGAWIRLAPSPQNVACAIATKAIQERHMTAAIMVSDDDYQMLVSAAFNTAFSEFGGVSLGALTISVDQESYLEELRTINDLQADVVVLMAYPKTASQITQEWMVAGMKGEWYLAPTLHTDMFLQNVPFGALEGFSIFSPSLSQPSECEVHDEDQPEVMDCERNNANRFTDHYTSKWHGDYPSPTSMFYYDAVVLLALGLQRAKSDGMDTPSPIDLRQYIEDIAESPGESITWSRIKKGLNLTAAGTDVFYSGAATEYTFDFRGELDYGEADHPVMDTWEIKNNAFVWSDSIGLLCNDAYRL